MDETNEAIEEDGVELVDDEYNENEEDDDPIAEGELPPTPKKKISEAMANSWKFHTVCRALEDVWKAGSKKPVEKRLSRLLPPKALAVMLKADPPESIYPLFRLLLPFIDTRMTNVGESKVADMYSGMLNLPKGSKKRRMLCDYNDPTLVKKEEGLSDFSSVVRTVIKSTKVDRASDLTVGEINQALDDFTRLKSKVDKGKEKANRSPTKKRKIPTLKEYQVEWLRKLSMDTDDPKRNGLSPLEHKWLVRILIQRNMNFGLGWQAILRWYHPYMAMAYTARSSLRGVCNDFCDPAHRQSRAFALDQTKDKVGLEQYMPQSPVAPKFGTIFTPMVSEKTGFDRVLDNISRRHRSFIKMKETQEKLKHVPADCLAFRHPAFCVEPKLDGERFLVHVGSDGVVKMHTRRGNWYSNLYSPVLGPPIREAVEKGLDLILDGEVIAWDSQRRETIPFGNNRGIANYRKRFLASQNLLDDRDKDIHSGDGEHKSVSSAYFYDKDNDDSELAGAECWLQFIVFDILYINGASANYILSESVSKTIQPRPVGGSIIHLDLFERKKILYRAVKPKKDFVEIITCWIIRPNGTTEMGEAYFSPTAASTECGFSKHTVDSQSCIIKGAVEKVGEVDLERRSARSDEQISESRASCVHELFKEIEKLKMEGLMFKDLATPYYLGDESRSLRYWLKFKPDYFNGSVASDLDLAVVGSFYATGLSRRGADNRAGLPSGLLCACVDSKNPHLFFPVCKVNAGSMSRDERDIFFKACGLKSGEESLGEDKWFRLDKSSKEVPDFISQRSFQVGEDGKGWKAQKKDYPHEWIHPSDCPILTLNAGEIVESPVFSVGLSLRFPRITRIRVGADSKPLTEIESEHSLWTTYQGILDSRSNAFTPSTSVQLGSPMRTALSRSERRFLTEAEYTDSKSKRTRKTTTKKLQVAVPEARQSSSEALEGLSFAVLGSKFRLTEGSVDFDEALEQGWVNDARSARAKNDIIKFIKSHGGKYRINPDENTSFILGGNAEDAQVLTYIKAIRSSRGRVEAKQRIETKRDELDSRLAGSDGVLRWTFVYSLVHTWMKRSETGAIKDKCPAILKVTPLDYLARPGASTSDANLYELDFSSQSQIRRALEMVSNDFERDQVSSDWQTESNFLDVTDRWVSSCGWEEFWPHTQHVAASKQEVVIYPDIFSSHKFPPDKTEEFRWSEVQSDVHSGMTESVLPLLRVMGATIRLEFDCQVTHVLCAMSNGVESVQLSDSDVRMFADRVKGKKLLDQAMDIGTDNGGIMFISPQWVRQKFRDGR